MILKRQYPKHYVKMDEIRIKVNELSQLINELGELESTGVENIDNLYLALHMAHSKTIDVFIVDEEK